MTYLYLDIETIPAQTEAAKQKIAASVKPPAQMKKAETIAAWEKESRAAAVDEAVSRSGLNGAFGHICCIGYAFDAEKPKSLSWPLDYSDERSLLVAFAEAMTGQNRIPTIVGHNVASFDVRFLWQRAMVLGVRMPAWFPKDPKPWSQDVFDTMAAWAGARDTISMSNLCDALGLPGKDDIDGSMIGDLFARGEFERIDSYCRADIERTRAIHRRMLVAFGEEAA
ncbi:ribonuclease H-like domain-containing protein [Rhizobium johnstonii]|uniref:ribonuclease H-like domain-containing protein n=1 Tax=Rhizobium johnstonii TaxID=3019933 RepID=UPI003F978867